MSKRDVLLLLNDILDSIHEIQKYTQTMSFNQFIQDDKTIDAVVRNVAVF